MLTRRNFLRGAPTVVAAGAVAAALPLPKERMMTIRVGLPPPHVRPLGSPVTPAKIYQVPMATWRKMHQGFVGLSHPDHPVNMVRARLK